MEINRANYEADQRNGFAPRRQYETVHPMPGAITIVPVMGMNIPNPRPHNPGQAMAANELNVVSNNYNNYANQNNNDININHNNVHQYPQQPQQQQQLLPPPPPIPPFRPMAHANNRKSNKTAIVSNNKLSLEDSLKMTDSSGLAMKTPVSLLQEILSRRGITPNYELVQIEGAIHEPTFRYRVSFNDKDVPFTAMGAGRSKKEAKHSAARSLIDKLTGIQIMDSQTNVCSSNTSVPDGYANMNENNLNNAGSGDGDKVLGNPIGWLQEMCMSRRWPPPNYETETEVGLPHERLFTIACTILNFREVGKGKSKKIAKRMAAHKMWTRLQETPLDNEQMLETMRSEFDGDKNYYGDLKDINVPILTSQHSHKVSQFHKTLKNSTGKKLLKLQQVCLADTNIDHIKLLNELAQENQFEITYVEIEEKSISNLYQCLVQISTLPVGVCHGCGTTALEAQRQAAQNALEYIKIMTKK